jgi:hypothetical protein
MESEEGYIDVPGGKVWYRAVGDNADTTPPTSASPSSQRRSTRSSILL